MTNIAESPEPDNAPAPAAGARPTVANRFQIDPASPLDNLSRPDARAYAAVDLNDPKRPVYAVIANPRLPIRLRAMHQTHQIQSDSFTMPIRVATVNWPATGRNESVLLLPMPAGAPLMSDLAGKTEPMPHHRIIRQVVPAIVDMLAEMQAVRVSHRAIRPDNLFVDAETGKLTVGECFSVPAGYAQPAIFEPLERSMCVAAGRGEGETADDLFALGVTILFLALGGNPVAELEPDTLVARRQMYGSYTALVGKRRVPVELIQALRSLLRDDPEERWTAEDLTGWLLKGRGNAVQSAVKPECSRPFEFADRKFITTAGLALALGRDWSAGLEMVKSGKVEKWVDKVLKDKKCSASLAKTRVSGANGPRTVTSDLLMARTLSALDPTGPLRYRDLIVMPDGIGALIASVHTDAGPMQQVDDMLKGMLPSFAFALKSRPSYAMFTAEEMYTQMLTLLSQSVPGFGIERVLYEMNPGVACQSPIVLGENITGMTQLLKALDKQAAGQESLLDRHIAAFMATRISGSIDRGLGDITLVHGAGEKMLAQLKLFAYAQSKSDAHELPGLCRYFLDKSAMILETYRNIPLRAKLAKAARGAAETGDLEGLHKVLGSEKSRRWDARNYNAAKQAYRHDEVEVMALQASIATIPQRSHSVGKQTGAIASAALGVAASAVIMLMQIA